MTRSSRKPPSQRQLRVGEEMRHALVRILAAGRLHDPDLADISLTVTEVRVSPDLKSATAFVLPFAGGDAEKVVSALQRASGFLQRELAAEVELRSMPKLGFARDTSFERVDRIERLLADPKVARDLGKAEPDDEGDGA